MLCILDALNGIKICSIMPKPVNLLYWCSACRWGTNYEVVATNSEKVWSFWRQAEGVCLPRNTCVDIGQWNA